MDTQPTLLDVPARRRCDRTCRAPGASHAHCGACHRTFGSVSDFDRHRVDGGHGEGRCTHPAGLGLTEHLGLWASPERHANDARLAEQLAAARSTVVRHSRAPLRVRVRPHRAPGAGRAAAAAPTRDVPVPPALAEMLDRHLHQFPPVDGRLFVVRRGPGRGLSPRPVAPCGPARTARCGGTLGGQRSLQPRWRPRWLTDPMIFATRQCQPGSTAVSPQPRWPRGPVTASRFC